MKKSLLLVASAALVLGLAACNSSTPVDTGSTNTNTEPGPGGDVDVPTVEEETTNEDNYVLINKKALHKEKSAKDDDGNIHWYKIISNFLN